MKASDVMVSKVITVGLNTTVHEIANILLSNRISAVPVLDDMGALVGIVSEGDLIHRIEAGTERHYSWWLRLVSGNEVIARDFVKSHATKAGDVMTREVITASPDLPLAATPIGFDTGQTTMPPGEPVTNISLGGSRARVALAY